MTSDLIVGIDLGTTNSSIAVTRKGLPEVLAGGDDGLLPSCVGMDAEDRIVVGRPARNQAVLFPDRTVLSIKRKMGSDEIVRLGETDYTPERISSFILGELVSRARSTLRREISRAIITVPAYFNDAQRKATRTAGELAGLKVERILNEPTAASLVYEADSSGASKILVYDLGGGTFDVSVVSIEQGVVEVLATAGNNRLGGDDFDALIVERLNQFLDKETGGESHRSDRTAQARLRHAAEAAKRKLSDAPFAMIEEDNLKGSGRKPLNLSYELSRTDFENDIQDLLHGSLDEVSRSLNDAQVRAGDLDRILLVGGSTRIPLVSRLLQERLGMTPHGEVDPDRCVALGAAIQAGMEAGEEVSSVLVDITPYTFGIKTRGELNGMLSLHRYAPMIPRNSKLPVTKSDLFFAMTPEQESALVEVFQGEDPDTRNNTRIGGFTFDGLNKDENAYEDGIVVTYSLNVDGILDISARERVTGKQISGRIEDALAARPDDDPLELELGDGADQAVEDTIKQLLENAQALLAKAPAEDLAEIERLIKALESAVQRGDTEKADQVAGELAEILFFIE